MKGLSTVATIAYQAMRSMWMRAPDGAVRRMLPAQIMAIADDAWFDDDISDMKRPRCSGAGVSEFIVLESTIRPVAQSRNAHIIAITGKPLPPRTNMTKFSAAAKRLDAGWLDAIGHHVSVLCP